jgi:outer membrane biosynthesis protein TonB
MFVTAIPIGQIALAEESASSLTQTESAKKADAEFASMASELGKFQHKLYLLIGRKWNLKVQQSMAQIGEGRVVIKFHVNPSGKITNISFVEGSPDSKLGTISYEAIVEGGESCDQFSEALKKEKPNGFYWQLAYKIK